MGQDEPIMMQEFAPEQIFACRCEEVSLAEVARALAAGAVSLNDVKRRTRAGMGICQGIFCMPVIAAMVAQATGAQIDRIAPMTARPPLRPLLIDALANLDSAPMNAEGHERDHVGD